MPKQLLMNLKKIGTFIPFAIIIFFCFFCNTCYCQKDSACSYTINKNEGNGLSIKIFTLCNWKSFEGRPGVIKAFEDSNGTSLVIMIAKAKENSDAITLEKRIRNEYKQFAKVISTRNTKLEGLPSVEVIVEYSEEKPIGVIYSKCVMYQTVYKNYLFALNYACAGFDKEETNKRFEENLYTFKVLASRTILLNKTTF